MYRLLWRLQRLLVGWGAALPVIRNGKSTNFFRHTTAFQM